MYLYWFLQVIFPHWARSTSVEPLFVVSFLYYFDVEPFSFSFSLSISENYESLSNFPELIFQSLYYNFICVALVILALILIKYIPMLNHKYICSTLMYLLKHACSYCQVTQGVDLCVHRFWVFIVVVQTVKNLPALQETWVQSLGWEDPLEKGMATHSSICAWRIPWTEEPGELQSLGL